MENIEYYIFALVVLVGGFLVIKKVATCILKFVVALIALAIIASIYWLYIS